MESLVNQDNFKNTAGLSSAWQQTACMLMAPSNHMEQQHCAQALREVSAQAEMAQTLKQLHPTATSINSVRFATVSSAVQLPTSCSEVPCLIPLTGIPQAQASLRWGAWVTLSYSLFCHPSCTF
jgi:predicted homoserine dehydrogenase-like protein